MALREILLIDRNEEVLRRKSRPVVHFDERLSQLLDDLLDTLHTEGNGAGLAAPQVGVLRRVAVIDLGEGAVELVNPEILEVSGEMECEEGCLSQPGKYVRTLRPAYVKARVFDRNGNEAILEGEKFMALALAHEIGHLDGELFTDFMIEEQQQDGG